MAQYEAVHSVYETNEKNKTTYLRRPGTTVEIPDEDAERLLELGAIKRPDSDEDQPAAGRAEEGEVTLPQRPSNSASKDTWRAYLHELATATDPWMDEPLAVPDDANRDQMIAIGDQRVRDFEGE